MKTTQYTNQIEKHAITDINMVKLKNIHPGEILVNEFIIPRNISDQELALALDISKESANMLMNGELDIDPKIAYKLSDFLGNSVEFWLGLQKHYNGEETPSFQELQEKYPHLKPTDMSNIFYRAHRRMDSIFAKHNMEMKRDFPYLYIDKSP